MTKYYGLEPVTITEQTRTRTRTFTVYNVVEMTVDGKLRRVAGVPQGVSKREANEIIRRLREAEA